MKTETVASALEKTRLVLFDFDGPLCHVFAGFPATTVARALEQLAGGHFDTDDPLCVLEEVSRTKPEVLMRIEQALITAERSAVAVSEPIPGGVAALRAAIGSGRQAGIVTNNSKEAVAVFLEMMGLSGQVSLVVGRMPGRPDLMKPNPWPLLQALELAGCTPDSAVFVGDSMSDIEAANAAAIPCLAYANKAGKRALFESTDAVLIEDMAELTGALASV